MMKKAAIFLIFGTILFAGESSVCVDIQKEDLHSKSLLHNFTDLYEIQDSKFGQKLLKKRILFAKAYLKKYGLSDQDRDHLKILVLNYLAKRYTKKFLSQYEPTDKEAYSYYLLHQKEYKQPFDVVKKRIKEQMLKIKSISLIEQELRRLEHEEN